MHPEVGVVNANDSGFASVLVWPRDLRHLALAFDPAGGRVVVEEQHAGPPTWQEASVPFPEAHSPPKQLLVRNVSFDVALTPEEFSQYAEERPGAGVFAWQLADGRVPNVSLAAKDEGALEAALKGLGALALVQYPGQGDYASIVSPDARWLRECLARLDADQG